MTITQAQRLNRVAELERDKELLETELASMTRQIETLWAGCDHTHGIGETALDSYSTTDGDQEIVTTFCNLCGFQTTDEVTHV